ncbi:MAG: Rne/Rng family ribonuclease [Rhodospirillales bacterium]|nr:Rne/Rng family ribonuclease [Rhodospirillales bacterium]
MTKRMLIDAAHPEETRVAIVDGNRLEELDVESAARRQLKGNIYLAKVKRVEPSLQAAFVDYGGNRHGFLAFSEIHPDYYQIPVADREALIAEDEAAEAAEAEAEADETDAADDGKPDAKGVETIGGGDIDDVEERRANRPVRRYKIQEVIKRRQILLIQVVKEERGNKGAALTTYLSLAGRYCVLMPNTARGGGISRKISNAKDRKRLKSIISELDIPKGIAVIVRTAGSDRGKAEIKRDYEYLIKLWDNVRTRTLESTAPDLIHEEANLINRSIRDQYTRDIDEILVEGDDGYRAGKDLMKMLVPSHAKKVQPYRDPAVPLFQRYHVESQLETMHSQDVQLKSGGYIVLNSTEALVAIDVNSGRATRGRNIEETALKTNLEAASEIARQLKLRDLAGLIVIDFIDMDVNKNQTAVERKLKEAMRHDRARIQIGRISPFGLLELSRQRLRPSLAETYSDPCPHCGGSGIRRSVESTAVHVLRGIEEEGVRGRATEIEVAMPPSVALYILNHKRETIARLEEKFGFGIIVSQDDRLIPPDYDIKRTTLAEGAGDDDQDEAPAKGDGQSADEGRKKKRRRRGRRRRGDDQAETQADNETGENESGENEELKPSGDETEPDESAEAAAGSDEDDGERKKPRRRGRRGGRRRSRTTETEGAGESNQAAETAEEGDAAAAAPEQEEEAEKTPENAEEKPKPRRRRRVRRRAASSDAGDEAAADEDGKSEDPASEAGAEAAETPEPADPAAPSTEPEAEPVEAPEPLAAAPEPDTDSPREQPVSVEESAPAAEPEPPASTPVIVQEGDDAPAEPDPGEPPKRGWWSR